MGRLLNSENIYYLGTAGIREARMTEEDKKRIERLKNDTRPLTKKLLDFPKALFIIVRNEIKKT